LIDGFTNGCRSINGRDGCNITHECGGILPNVVDRDANNQLFPIAWDFVETEYYSYWTWFLHYLLEAIGPVAESIGGHSR